MEVQSNAEETDSSEDEFKLKIDESILMPGNVIVQVIEQNKRKHQSIEENNEVKETGDKFAEVSSDKLQEQKKLEGEPERKIMKKEDESKKPTLIQTVAFKKDIQSVQRKRQPISHALNSTFQKIIRREKRRIFLKNLKDLRPGPDKLSFHKKEKANDLNFISLDNKLEKYGTTVKKMIIPLSGSLASNNDLEERVELSITNVQKIPEVPVILKPSPIPVRSVLKRPEITNYERVVNQMSGSDSKSNEIKKNIIKKPVSIVRPEKPFVLPKPSLNQDQPSTSEMKSPLGSNKVRLQKASDGSYEVVSNTQTKFVLHKDPSKTILNTSNDKQAQKKLSTVKPPVIRIKIPSSSEDIPTVTKQQLNHFSAKRVEENLTVKPKVYSPHPLREKTPEPIKYVIPQDLLLSDTDKVKNVQKDSNSLETENNAENLEEKDLFIIENDQEEDKKSLPEVASSSNKNRRKATLVPRTDDDEQTMFEQPVKQTFKMPARPKINNDLIDQLAKYRAIVGCLLEKLNQPQIDFNEDGDEYINIYKIFRS